MHAFSHPQVRQSLRLALGLLMPVAMMFAMILVVVCIFRHLEYARYDPQVILTNLDSMPWDDKTVQVSEELKMRRQLTGSFWAPNAQTKAWRMIPLLKDGWQADIPIELWVKSTDRLDSILAEQPLKFAKVTSQVDDFRLLQAIANAESRYGVKSAEAVLVLEPVADPDKQLDEGNGFALIGFTLCLLSWSVCSLFWPRNPQPASSSE